MEIIITEWALNSYLELKREEAFSDEEYWDLLRPDVLRLRTYPDDPKFNQGKFWSLASDRSNERIPDGYKMKWHQLGSGLVQLRLTVGIFSSQCFLCEAYVKKDEKVDKRKLARFKTYLQLIRKNCYTTRGKLR